MKYIQPNYEELLEVGFLSHYTFKTNGFVAGGCFKNIFKKETIKDIDIFFENEKDLNEAVKVYEEDEYKIKRYENDKCIAYRDTNTNMNIELVRSIYGTMEEILEYFDFTIVKFAYRKVTTGYNEEDEEWEYEHQLLHHEHFFRHLLQKRVVIDYGENDIPYPYSTFERMFRYQSYGYAPCRESKIKIVKAIRLQEEFNDKDLSQSFYDGVD